MKIVDTTDWPDSLRQVASDMHANPLNVHKLIANQPELLKCWWQFRKYIVRGGSLDARHAEIVILRTAAHVGAPYEWDSHVVRGHEAGLSIDEIERIRQGAGAGWSPRDAVLISAVDELYTETRLAANTVDALADAFGEPAALDLIAIVSTYQMLGMMLNTWPVDLDEQTAAKLAQIKKAPT
jgi:alkylhydroperoxidase family enzyme